MDLLMTALLATIQWGGTWQAVNFFDSAIISFLNGFAHRSYTIDTFMYLLDFNPLMKAIPILAVVWWAWFKDGESSTNNREFLLFGIMGSAVAVAVARTLSLMVPFRERPMRNSMLHFILPYNVKAEHLLGWNSFPSDNAALFFSVATSVIFISWRAGVFAVLYSCLTVVSLAFTWGFTIRLM